MKYSFICPTKLSPQPIPEAHRVFTDGSAHSGNAALISEGQSWVKEGFASAQKSEFDAIIYAFEIVPKEPLDIVSDLAYSALVTKQIETSLIHPNVPPKLLTIML
jgi:hypothetical protein